MSLPGDNIPVDADITAQRFVLRARLDLQDKSLEGDVSRRGMPFVDAFANVRLVLRFLMNTEDERMLKQIAETWNAFMDEDDRHVIVGNAGLAMRDLAFPDRAPIVIARQEGSALDHSNVTVNKTRAPMRWTELKEGDAIAKNTWDGFDESAHRVLSAPTFSLHTSVVLGHDAGLSDMTPFPVFWMNAETCRRFALEFFVTLDLPAEMRSMIRGVSLVARADGFLFEPARLLDVLDTHGQPSAYHVDVACAPWRGIMSSTSVAEAFQNASELPEALWTPGVADREREERLNAVLLRIQTAASDASRQTFLRLGLQSWRENPSSNAATVQWFDGSQEWNRLKKNVPRHCLERSQEERNRLRLLHAAMSGADFGAGAGAGAGGSAGGGGKGKGSGSGSASGKRKSANGGAGGTSGSSSSATYDARVDMDEESVRFFRDLTDLATRASGIREGAGGLSMTGELPVVTPIFSTSAETAIPRSALEAIVASPEMLRRVCEPPAATQGTRTVSAGSGSSDTASGSCLQEDGRIRVHQDASLARAWRETAGRVLQQGRMMMERRSTQETRLQSLQAILQATRLPELERALQTGIVPFGLVPGIGPAPGPGPGPEASSASSASSSPSDGPVDLTTHDRTRDP